MGAFLRQLLSISTMPMQLQIHSRPGEYNMRGVIGSKSQMDRRVQKSELSVNRDPMKLHIDYSETSASLGFYSPTQRKDKIVSESKQKVLKVIGETCQNGDQMMKTQGKVYADICHRKFIGDPYTLVQGTIPHPPKITWSGTGTVDVDFTPYRENINWAAPQKPEVEYNVRKPEVSVAQWHKVDIAYNGTLSDVLKIGIEGVRKLHIEV